MHVCMYVRTYVCMCVRMQRVYVSVCLSVCLSVFVCVRACACRGRGLPVYGYTFCMFIQKTDLFAEFTEEEGEYTCSRKEEFATERERGRDRERERESCTPVQNKQRRNFVDNEKCDEPKIFVYYSLLENRSTQES